MIEAVNSVLSNAQVLRGSTEGIDSARSFAANPERVQEISTPQAPFISPFISVDVNFDTAVLQIRDSDTGDVVQQFPSEARLEEQQRAARAAQNARLATSEQTEPQAPQGTDFTSIQSQNTGVSNISASSGSPGVAEAQIASQALAAGAQAGSGNLSAGVNVAA